MKKLKALAIGLLALSIGFGGAKAATVSKSIDASKCETVYTNYYFFLDINSKEYYSKKPLSSYTHNTVAEYKNNSWRVSDFDVNNVGYGQVTLNQGSITSSDGITSMSLEDFYTLKRKSHETNGAFSEGLNNYIVSHGWYEVNDDDSLSKKTSGTDTSKQSIEALVNASLDGNATISLRDSINPNSPNPFKIQINRKLYGYLTGKPLVINNQERYVHPALFYIQYCSPKKSVQNYEVNYDGNGDNVTNVPGKQTSKVGECVTIQHAPTREGYEFLGWSREAKDTTGNPTYAVNNDYCGNVGSITLYAIWKKKDAPITSTYTIIYNSNTTDAVAYMPENATINSDKDAYISTNIPVRPGYEFLGWSTDATSSNGDEDFKGGSLYQDRKDLVLYAIWRENKKPVDPTPENPENPKTGVSDYLLPACGTVGLSGIGLQVLKKKKTFKQF